MSQQRYFSPTLQYISNLCAKDALHQAVKSGDIKKIQQLIYKRYDVNAEDQDGMTPLLYAIESKNANIVNLLIQNGANVDNKNTHGHKPLFCAVVMDDPDIAIIQLLVKSGANVNVKDKDGVAPLLLWAISSNKSVNIIQFLVESGANVDAKNAVGNTPLFYAIKIKNPDIIEFLVQQGANINAQDAQGKTYLHKTSDWQLAELLKSLGARSDIKDQNGKTACDYAAENGDDKLRKILSSKQPLSHLEQSDQDVSELIGVDDMFEKCGEPAENF